MASAESASIERRCRKSIPRRVLAGCADGAPSRPADKLCVSRTIMDWLRSLVEMALCKKRITRISHSCHPTVDEHAGRRRKTLQSAVHLKCRASR